MTLSNCPRCHGNLGLEYDFPFGRDIVCLQCGFRTPAIPNFKPLPRVAVHPYHDRKVIYHEEDYEECLELSK